MSVGESGCQVDFECLEIFCIDDSVGGRGRVYEFGCNSEYNWYVVGVASGPCVVCVL